MKKFIEELKRRHVIKSALAYLVVAWVLLQVLQFLLPLFEAPEWILKGLTLLMAIGLPIWIIISWIYDITPEGIEKTSKDSDNELKTELTNKRLNVFIIVSLSIAVVVLTLNLSFFSSDADKRYAIAVLPFDNMNVDEDNDWISKGLSIDIHTYLSKIENLTIISERSVNEALDSKKTLPEIAELLNVTYFVGGSVRQFNDDIIINAHLTNTSNEKDEWVENYNRNLDNPFKVQQDVSQKIVAQLKVELTPEEEKTLATFPTENMEAYSLFTKGHLINMSRDKEDLELNIELNKQAIALDPNFTEAYTEIALSTWLLGFYYAGSYYQDSQLDYESSVKNATPYLEKALELDPNNALANSIKGAFTSNEGDWNTAHKYFERAIASNPNNATIRYQYGLHADLNNNAINISQTTKGQELDPLSALIGHRFFGNLINNNKIEEAEEYYNKYSFLFTYDGEKLEKESILIAYKNKDWTAAIRFFEAELKKDPNNAILNRKLGEAYDGILLDDDNYLKYTERAYELDSTNLVNGEQYFFALLESEHFKEAKKLIENKNFKSLSSKSIGLNYLFNYYLQKENYKKAQEVLKDGDFVDDGKHYFKLSINARLGNKKFVDSLFREIEFGPIRKAILYAHLSEKDSMYHSLDKSGAVRSQRMPDGRREYSSIRQVNNFKAFDPYRKEERFKAILRKYYLPITHWNE